MGGMQKFCCWPKQGKQFLAMVIEPSNKKNFQPNIGNRW